MQFLLANTLNYLSYYHLTLFLGDFKRYMGRVNHLQVFELSREINHKCGSHSIRFYDGMNHRELLGTVRLDDDDDLTLDMGQGKSYRFKKQEC